LSTVVLRPKSAWERDVGGRAPEQNDGGDAPTAGGGALASGLADAAGGDAPTAGGGALASGLADAAGGDAPTNNPGWVRCDWFQGSSSRDARQRACAQDDECPARTSEFSAWFDAVASEHGLSNGSRLRVAQFLADIKEAEGASFSWSADRAELRATYPMGPSSMKKTLKRMYDEDAAFRGAVTAMARDEEGVIKSAIDAQRVGACDRTRKVCTHGPGVAAPALTLFDGTQTVTFQRHADGGVAHTRGGVVGGTRVASCDADDAPALCRDASVPEVARTADGVPTLSARADRVAPYYRVSFRRDDGSDDRYLVSNAVEAYGTLDPVAHGEHTYSSAQWQCAVQLCKRNATGCPASHCRVNDDAECVPRVDKVKHVGTRPVDAQA